MKLYIVGPEDGGEGLYQLVAETGEGLAGHYCSHQDFAKGDLIANRLERIKEYAGRFGLFDVLFLGEDDMTIDKLIELNKEYHLRQEEEK